MMFFNPFKEKNIFNSQLIQQYGFDVLQTFPIPEYLLLKRVYNHTFIVQRFKRFIELHFRFLKILQN